VSVKDSSGVLLDGKFGSVIGHIRYSANIGNCYTSLPAAECVEVGTDDLASLEAGDIAVLTLAQMSGPEAINTMKLGEGWVANASGLPTIDVAAALVAAEKPVETTAAETTAVTDAPAVTTAAPVETTTPVKETTAAPEVTTAAPAETTSAPENTDEVSDDDGGANIYVILIFVVIAATAGVIVYIVISEKKKTK
jgi:cell division septation protein DedD